ncbi:MAG: M20/M25/M40 family metallo-hydrolase, partial [Alphaproteobacteria bacterium]
GGINTNVVPDEVSFRIDRRIIPDEIESSVEEALIHRIEESLPEGKGTSVACRRVMMAEPLRPLDGVDAMVATISRHATALLGENIAATAVPIYTDARHYAAAGIPTVLYGAGPHNILEANAHAADEHLQLSDLRAATEVIALSLSDLLRVA